MFGRRGRRSGDRYDGLDDEHLGDFGAYDDEDDDLDGDLDDGVDGGWGDGGRAAAEGARLGSAHGPYDVTEEPADGQTRLDLGSVRLPVPDHVKLQVEVEKSGPVRAVQMITPRGQLTVTAFAAPRSGGLWTEVRREIAARFRAEGIQIMLPAGRWGREVTACTAEVAMRFVGVEGPRWLVRGLAAGPPDTAAALSDQLDQVLAGTIVDRGTEPMPVRNPLPLRLPEHLAGQLKQAAPIAG